MSLKKLIDNYSAYHAWANERLLAFLQPIPSDLLYQEVPSSFRSIIKTMNHMLATQEFWHCIIVGITNSSQRWSNENPDIEEVFTSFAGNTEKVKQDFLALTELELLQQVLVERPWFTSDLPRYEYIQHLVNHTSYHRGQIITMTHVLGLSKAPNTDYQFYNVHKSGNS